MEVSVADDLRLPPRSFAQSATRRHAAREGRERLSVERFERFRRPQPAIDRQPRRVAAEWQRRDVRQAVGREAVQAGGVLAELDEVDRPRPVGLDVLPQGHRNARNDDGVRNRPRHGKALREQASRERHLTHPVGLGRGDANDPITGAKDVVRARAQQLGFRREAPPGRGQVGNASGFAVRQP